MRDYDNIMESLWKDIIIPIADSTFLQSLVTAGVGSFAIYIYKKQRKDIKSEAALAIYNELQIMSFKMHKPHYAA